MYHLKGLIMNKDTLMKSVVIAFLALTTQSALAASPEAEPVVEKCYGIVKAGMNDCATAKESCASSATKDNQKDAYLLMPKGLCAKIAGSSLKPE